MTTGIEMGQTGSGQPVLLDLEELLATRLLVQGNSGSGKSHLLRRLLEQSAPWVQQAVIDPEGDFATLADGFSHLVIDAAAHTGALRHRRTIAAVAGGLDIAYPPENRDLQDRIAEGGLLLAESPLGTAPLARHFPRRNRIVAGLALGVVVIEAAHRSGTLITARLGAEAGREIYAVPGSPLDPRCAGSNDLLRQGAHFCETAADILETLPATAEAMPVFARPAPGRPSRAPAPPRPTREESSTSDLLSLIGPSPVPVDEVLRRCHLSPPDARAALLELELEGLIEALPGNRVVRSGIERSREPEA